MTHSPSKCETHGLGIPKPTRGRTTNGPRPRHTPIFGQGDTPPRGYTPRNTIDGRLSPRLGCRPGLLSFVGRGSTTPHAPARAIAAEPDLLLVDEPTAQLDTSTATVVNRSLHGMSDRGIIVVIATHDPNTRDACSVKLDLTDYTDTDPGDTA